MPKQKFIEILSKYIDLNNYDIRFKKSPYYNNENEVWIYRKDDDGERKRVIVGYTLNGKFYKTSKEMRKDFQSGYNDYKKEYGYKSYRIGLVITEEDLKDEKYLKDYLIA